MGEHESLKKQLMDLDREFDRVTAETGIEGWVSFFAEDGVMLPAQTGPIIGHDAIRQAMGGAFAQPHFSLRWEPLNADVSDDGTMGFTYGQYVRTNKDTDGNEINATGKYTSIWKKQADGSWKIVFDMGN